MPAALRAVGQSRPAYHPTSVARRSPNEDARRPRWSPERTAGHDRAGRETLWRELRGVVERITYQNPENGYTVARLAPERAPRPTPGGRGDDRLVTLVGTLPDLQPGEAIVAAGLVAQRPQARLAVPGARLPHHPARHPPGDEALPRLRAWSRGSAR